MNMKYNLNIKSDSVIINLKRLTNQIYKLLPSREEGLDWQKPLQTIIEELSGMSRILIDQQSTLFSLLCKLDGLFILVQEEDFSLYRRIIFECLGLMDNIKNLCQDQKI